MLIKDIFAIFVFIQQETKMRIFKRIALTAVLFLIASVSSLAVFNEKDLAQTLQVLRYELRKAYIEMEKNQMSSSLRMISSTRSWCISYKAATSCR